MNYGMSCIHIDQEVTHELRLAITCLRGSQCTRSEPGVEVVWKFRVGWCRSGSAAGCGDLRSQRSQPHLLHEIPPDPPYRAGDRGVSCRDYHLHNSSVR
jgi:hypothetical protein